MPRSHIADLQAFHRALAGAGRDEAIPAIVNAARL